MPFYKKDYYHADLNRVCDFEELIIEWCQLKDISNTEQTDKILQQNGYEDLLDHSDDFQFIAQTFHEKSNLELMSVEIGGIDFRVMKLKLKAGMPSKSQGLIFKNCSTVVNSSVEATAGEMTQYYALLDAFITVK